MKTRVAILIVVLMLFAAALIYAIPIGSFPRLNWLIDLADAIVILRIDRNLYGFGSPDFYSTHECFIYQSLKGDIAKDTRIILRLMDTQWQFATPYAWGSTHLMFLQKKATANEPTDYRTLMIPGAHILLSPLGHEKPPQGSTVEEQVRNLIRESLAYQTQEYEKQQKFLKSMLAGQITEPKE